MKEEEKSPIGCRECLACHHYWLNKGDCTGSAEKCSDFIPIEGT